MGKGALRGILFKDAESIERMKDITTVVFDKTGTITHGTPTITDIVPLAKQISKETIMSFAAALEQHSLHPLARAITEEAKNQQRTLLKASEIVEKEGFGISGIVENQQLQVRKATKKELMLPDVQLLVEQGKTIVVVERQNTLLGVLALSDTLKEGVVNTVKQLHARNIKTVLLTGDHENSAQLIAKQAGIDTVLANILPQDKALEVQALQQKGEKVAFVGDGINDAPALTQADAGIAVSNGTDIAIESASVVLLNSDIQKVLETIVLSKQIVRTMTQNLVWASIYNVVGIPIAAGVLYPLTGILLHPAFAGLAMAGSSVSVVANSLLLKGKNI
jgi:P-type Cu+ transporter